MNTGLREDVKVMVNSLLTPHSRGLPLDKLLNEYAHEFGHHLPYKQLGYNSPPEFLASIPDVVKFIRYPSGHTVLQAVTHSKNSIMKEFVKSQRNSQASKNFRKVNNNHYEHPFRQNHPIHQQSNQFSVPPPRINSNSNMAVQYDKPFSSQVVQSKANTLKAELPSSSTCPNVEYEEQLVSEFKQILQCQPDGVAIAHVFALYSNMFKKELFLHRIQENLTSSTFFQRNSHVFCLWKRSDTIMVGLSEHNRQSSQLQTPSPSPQADKGLGAIPKIPSSKNTSNLDFQSPTNVAPPKFQSPTSAAVPLQFISLKNATALSSGAIHRTTNDNNIQIQWSTTDIRTGTPDNKPLQTVTVGASAQKLVRITPPKLVPVYWHAPPRTDDVLPPTFGVPKPKIKNVYEADISVARQAFPPNIGDFEYFYLIVAEVYSPGEFYWFLNENQKSIEDLTDDMTLFYSSNPEYVISRSEMYIGQLVAAMYTDNLWYRARIVGCHEDHFQVFYVDYGTKNFVKIERIRHLHVHFLQMPLQVFRGRMFGIQPLPHEPKWSFESGKRFLDIVKESKIIAAAKMIEETLSIPEYEIDTEYSLTLVDTSDKEKDVHINDYLIENGFAVPSEKEQIAVAVANPSYEYSTSSSTPSPVTSPVKKTATIPSPVPTGAFPSLDVNSVVNQLERTSVSSSSTSQTSDHENFDLVNPSVLSNGIASHKYRIEESVISPGEEPSFVPRAESIKSNYLKCVDELVLKDQRKLYIIEDSGELYLSKPDMLLLIPSLDSQIAALKVKIDCKVVTAQTHPHIFVGCTNIPWLKDEFQSQLTLYSLQYVSLLFFLCSVKDKVASLAIEAKRKEFSNK